MLARERFAVRFVFSCFWFGFLALKLRKHKKKMILGILIKKHLKIDERWELSKRIQVPEKSICRKI